LQKKYSCHRGWVSGAVKGKCLRKKFREALKPKSMALS
jgi:hypothetical protein